jgi:ABC-2 type transport system permease protein
MSALLSEWTKLRSVRITWITIASAVVAGVALGVVGTLGLSAADLPAAWDPTAASLKGILLSQVIIGMLGALSITSEYETGMIGTSVTLVPSRTRLLAAKATVVATVALVAGLVTTLLSFTVVQLLLSSAGVPTASLVDLDVLAAVVGATVYLGLMALIGLFVGVLTRSTTSSLAVLVGALLLAPALGPGLPGAVGEWFARFWPSTAGQAAYAVVPVDGAVEPLLGIAILAAATVVVSAVSQVSLKIRDI